MAGKKYTYSKELGGVGDEYGWAYEDNRVGKIRGKAQDFPRKTCVEHQTIRFGRSTMTNQTVYEAMLNGHNIRVFIHDGTGRTYMVESIGHDIWRVLCEAGQALIAEEV